MKLVEEHLGELETSTFVARVQSLGLHAIILVLIEISWTATDLKALEKHFVQSDHQTPNKLPLRYEDATEIFGPDRGRSFFNAQFCYAPVTIVKGEHQDIGPLMRVPILYDKEELGRGISGSVRKATFPPGVWQTRNGKLNTENQVVAVKKFDNKEFFEPEKEIYRALQKDGKNNNVVRCLGSLQHETTHGTDYLIFLPLALYNLDTFLNQPYVHPNRPANLFQDAADILDYAAGLACGLRYLHDVLDNEMGQEISVLHGDFKPQNILVYRDKPFIWKISDYGYSKTKPREQGQDDTTAAVREGTFVSPEAHSGRNITVASDLWGMGCVLIEVITYTVGGPDLVQAFRELRNQEGQGHDRFFVTGDEGVCVNPAVTRWCAHLPGIARNKDELLGEVINDVLAFLRDKLLVIDVEERKHTDAQRVRQALFDASRRLKNRDVARHSSQLFDRVRRRGTPLNDPTKRSDNDANPGKSKKHFDRLKRRLRSVFQRILRKAKWGTRKRTEGRNVGDAHVGMHG
jgi:serine/threonine protein kinase